MLHPARMMDAFQIVKLLGFVLMLSAGQLLFKQTALSTAALKNISGVLSLASNSWFWLAIGLYGSATVLWVAILQRTPLSVAYPFTALAFVAVPLASWAFMGESLNFGYFLGGAFIIAGIGVIAFSSFGM